MKITYYGTAAAEGIPALFCECDTCRAARKKGGRDIRTRSQAMIDDTLLIDLPADTYMHALFYGLPLTRVSHCLITHAHSDHLYADELHMRGFGFAPVLHEEAACLHLYGSDMVKRTLAADLYCRFKDEKRVAFSQLSPFQAYEIGGYTVTPLLALHDVHAGPYIYIIQKDGKTLLYGNDTGIFPDESFAYIEKSGVRFDFVSLDCTAGNGPMNYDSHMNLERNILIRNRLIAMGAADEKTIFCCNHFSHNGGGVLFEDFSVAAEKAGFLTAYDGMSMEF